LCHRHIWWVEGLIIIPPDVPKERFVHFSGISYPPKVPPGLRNIFQAIAAIYFANKIPDPIILNAPAS
jgi:hypothetical protein